MRLKVFQKSSLRTRMCTKSTLPSTSKDEIRTSPNRQKFESEIWRVNNSISKVYNELKRYWSESRREELGKIKRKLNNCKAEYRACNEQESKLQHSLQELQSQHQQKQNEIHELEDSDLIYKDLNYARQKLTQLEEKYKNQRFSSVRDEQLQVNELNRIKRNILRLSKYLPLVDQRKKLEADIKKDRQLIREIRQKMRQYRDSMQECRKSINFVHQNFVKLKDSLADLKAEKRSLIEKYNATREKYDSSCKCNSKTFPIALMEDQGYDFLDLFHTQKSACNRLINYLTRLSTTIPTNGVEQGGSNSKNGIATHENNNISPQSDSDSAEDLPEALKNLNMKLTAVLQKTKPSNGNNNARLTKKAMKKTAMPLSHGIDYIKLFNDIDVSPPKTYADVRNALEEMKKVLDFYNNQTVLTTYEDYCPSPIPSLFSTTGSESLESSFASPRSLSSCSLVCKDVEDEASNESRNS